MNETLLRVEHVTLGFPDRQGGTLRVLDDVSLDVRAGETVALVGESGSGKTTLGKTILRLYRPQTGKILFDGDDLAVLREAGLKRHRRHLQMVFQDPLASFNPRFRIGASLALPMRLHGIAHGPAVRARVASSLREVGLDPAMAARFPHQLSGGQLQRVALARAMSVQPRLVVADEAVSKLDVSVRAQILNLMTDLRARHGIALVFITHDLGVARYLSQRVAVMQRGRIVEFGATADVFERPAHPYTRQLVAAREAA